MAIWKRWWASRLRAELFLLCIAVSCIVPANSYEQVLHPAKGEITIKASYANDTAPSYTIYVGQGHSYTLSQSYSWVRDQSSRFNLKSYSIDNGPHQTIDRVSRGNFTLDIPTDSSHSIVFFAVTQYPIEVNGTDMPAFLPQSPTGDNWFDADSDVVVSVPYVVKVDSGSRSQLAGWSLDGSEDVQVARQEGGTFSTGTIHIAGPHTAYLRYVPQYYVEVLSEFGHVTGAGWYDSGATATISAVPGQDFPIGHAFVGWQGVTDKSRSVNILVESPKTITANWSSDYTMLVVMGSVIAGGAAGGAAIKRRRGTGTAMPPRDGMQRGDPVEVQAIKPSQVDSAYAKEISDHILQKSIEKLDSFQAAGMLPAKRHARIKEEISRDHLSK